MEIPQTSCACLRVGYAPIEVDVDVPTMVDHPPFKGKAMQERWRCADCGMEFIKKGADHNREIGELRERLAKLEAALNRVWEVASGESQVAMDDTVGMEYLSDYVSAVWDELYSRQPKASQPEDRQ